MTDLKPALVPIALLLLEGCGFGVPLKEPTVVPDQAARSATIRLGESGRDDVHAALGAPSLESPLWRLELYRSDDETKQLDFVVVIVLPVPMGVSGEKRHGYVLVTYDEAERVSAVSAGACGEGTLAADTARWLALEADGIWWIVEPVRTTLRATLAADPDRLDAYLASRRRSSRCTIVAGCDVEEGCPDRLSIDGGEPFDPTPLTALCAPDAFCPEGTPLPLGEIEGRRFVSVPLVHAIDAPPGSHVLVLRSSRIPGGSDLPFDCAPGEVLYAEVRSSVAGAGSLRKGTLQTSVAFTEDAPPSWTNRGVALARDGRWLVEPGAR